MIGAFGLGTRLRLLAALLDGAVEQIYRRSGLDFRPRYYPVFQILMDRESASVGEFADILGLTQPAITQTLNRMRESGLVALTASDDQRERRYVLTDHARGLLPELQRIWDAVAAAAADLDRRLQSPLSDSIDQAVAALQDSPFDEMIQKRL